MLLVRERRHNHYDKRCSSVQWMDILILDKVEVGRDVRRQQSEQAAYTCYCSHVLVR